MRALVVDDSRATRLILQKILAEVGIAETYEAADGLEALDVIACTGDLDFVLIDWNMPNMNGHELVVALRARPELAHVKLMMVTAESELDKVVSAIEAGADEYLMKPFDAEAVAAKLALLGLDRS
ncbi:MAG: response regulator [Sandaracinaceae bacterium]